MPNAAPEPSPSIAARDAQPRATAARLRVSAGTDTRITPAVATTIETTADRRLTRSPSSTSPNTATWMISVFA